MHELRFFVYIFFNACVKLLITVFLQFTKHHYKKGLYMHTYTLTQAYLFRKKHYTYICIYIFLLSFSNNQCKTTLISMNVFCLIKNIYQQQNPAIMILWVCL